MFKSNLSVDHIVDVDILAVGLEHTPDINGFNLTINTIVNGIIDNLLITGFDKIWITKSNNCYIIKQADSDLDSVRPSVRPHPTCLTGGLRRSSGSTRDPG